MNVSSGSLSCGFWNLVFPVPGSRNVHMKLQQTVAAGKKYETLQVFLDGQSEHILEQMMEE